MSDSPFRLPLRETPWQGFDKFTTCPVCGGPWRPWEGSLLPCHAKCLLTEEAQDDLADEVGVTQADQAKRLGVSVAVIRASVDAALRRRK